jgi:hypothetical protein
MKIDLDELKAATEKAVELLQKKRASAPANYHNADGC